MKGLDNKKLYFSPKKCCNQKGTETMDKKTFFNRAKINNAERIHCENCFEQVVFNLRDKDHEFSMGLSTVLECLAFAVKNGDLPKLPQSWLSYADIVCETNFSFDEDICYYDYNSDRNN